MRSLALAVLTMLALAPELARAQATIDEEHASALREEGRAHLREGRIEDAFTRFREAADLTRDPTVWLEVAEAADRLRIDEVALAAYVRYLDERADAPDRAEIEGRVRVLRELASGRRFAVGPSGHGLVDWNGRPVLIRRPSQLISLAEWDGSVRGAPRPEVPELLPFPPEPGLGRRLSPP